MKEEIKTDLKIFVTQKKTDRTIKNYYLTYRKNGISGHKKYSSSADLLTELDGLNLIAGTWLPNGNGMTMSLPVSPLLLEGETSIPDDEEVKTVFSYKAIASSLTLAGTQPIVLVIMKGAGIGAQETILLTLTDLESIQNFTTQLLNLSDLSDNQIRTRI